MALPQPPMPHDRDLLPPSRAGRPAALHPVRPAGVQPSASCRRRSAATASSAPRQRPARRRAPGPATGTPASRRSSPTRSIAINIGVFVWLAFQDPLSLTGHRQHHPGASSTSAWPSRSSSQGEWYRLVTSGFLHFGIIHLAFNMLLLFQLGQLLEPAIGRIRFALLYFAALLAGSAGALLLPAERRSTAALGRRVRADGGGVRRSAQPRRQPVLDRHRHRR